MKEILKAANITRRHFNYLLAGERNAAPGMAKRLARATNTPKEIWVFGTARQRQQAIKSFIKGK